MQPKLQISSNHGTRKGNSRLGGFLLAVVVLAIVGIGALMMMDVPSPKQPIEKQLDASAFLNAHEQKNTQ